MKLNWNFQTAEGWGVLEKLPFVGVVWIFSGITHFEDANVLIFNHYNHFKIMNFVT